MKRSFSLAYLTTAPLSPLGSIVLAAKLGYEHIGIRIMPAAPGGEFSPLIEDKALLRATQASMKENRISIFDVEIVRINEQFDVNAYDVFLEVCSMLGAKAILVAGDDPDEARLTNNFAAFCSAAAQYGLTADLEFMPFTAVKSASQAHRIVKNAGQRNGGILVDALHFGRSHSSIDDLRAIPADMLHYVQICDALAGVNFTTGEMIQTARTERLFPGDGTIDLRTMLSVLPQDIPVSIEIPNVDLKRRLGIEGLSARALERSRHYV